MLQSQPRSGKGERLFHHRNTDFKGDEFTNERNWQLIYIYIYIYIYRENEEAVLWTSVDKVHMTSEGPKASKDLTITRNKHLRFDNKKHQNENGRQWN